MIIYIVINTEFTQVRWNGWIEANDHVRQSISRDAAATFSQYREHRSSQTSDREALPFELSRTP